MRTCVSCGDPIPEKKRKDAKYCDKPGCRGRAYRKRQAEAQAAEGKPHTHHATTVLTCECGRRYKILLSALDESESKAEPAQSTAPPQAITETVLPTAQPTIAPDTGPELQAESRGVVTQPVLLTDRGTQIAEDGAASEAEAEEEAAVGVTQAVLLTDQQADEPPSVPQPMALDDAQAVTQTDRSGAQASGVLTLELYFLRAGKHRLSLHQAVIRRRDGTWTLQPQTRAAFSLGAEGRSSLGGRPGGWGRYYAGHSPVEFGFDEDLVVMFWDQKARRGWVAQTGLLRNLLGDGWKAKLRELADGKRRAAAG